MAAFDQMSGHPPWKGPVALRVVFMFPRPKTHFRTGKRAGQIKDGVPVYKTSKPDLDKLMRALGDALTGIVFVDDSQLVDSHETKIYGPNPGVTVKLIAI